MNIQIPSIIYFMIAATLVVFGPLRAYYFGWKHRVPAEEETKDERKRRRNHMVWGAAWFVFGVYIAYLGLQLEGQAGALNEDPVRGRATPVKIVGGE